MQALENRTLDSKREMDIMTALDELQSMKARHSHVTADQALAAIKRSAPGVPEDEPLAVEDEELIRQMLAQGRSKRLDDDPEDGTAVTASGPGPPAGMTCHFLHDKLSWLVETLLGTCLQETEQLKASTCPLLVRDRDQHSLH